MLIRNAQRSTRAAFGNNERAVGLATHGLRNATVGRVPKAFRHPALGFVDPLIMHRGL